MTVSRCDHFLAAIQAELILGGHHVWVHVAVACRNKAAGPLRGAVAALTVSDRVEIFVHAGTGVAGVAAHLRRNSLRLLLNVPALDAVAAVR